MQPYAQHPALRSRQVAADLGMLVWLIGWLLVARAVHSAVLALAAPGRAVENLGTSVAGDMRSAAEAAQGVPIVGDELSGPFDALADAGGSVTGAPGRNAAQVLLTDLGHDWNAVIQPE